MLRKVFSYLILTNQIDIAEPKIYHHLVFLQEFGGLLGGCLTVKNEVDPKSRTVFLMS